MTNAHLFITNLRKLSRIYRRIAFPFLMVRPWTESDDWIGVACYCLAGRIISRLLFARYQLACSLSERASETVK